MSVYMSGQWKTACHCHCSSHKWNPSLTIPKLDTVLADNKVHDTFNNEEVNTNNVRDFENNHLEGKPYGSAVFIDMAAATAAAGTMEAY